MKTLWKMFYFYYMPLNLGGARYAMYRHTQGDILSMVTKSLVVQSFVPAQEHAHIPSLTQLCVFSFLSIKMKHSEA